MSAEPFVYTLVAYRANGIDTCLGCVMDQSNSDFDLSVFTDSESLVKYWAQHQFTQPSGREYCSTDYTLLLNGRDEEHEWGDELERDPETGDTWAYIERTKIAAALQAKLAELSAARQAEADRKAAQAEAARQESERKAQAAKEAHERAEFARLQAKFGGRHG